MSLIQDVIIVFGLGSLLLLVAGIWAHFDLRKKQRQDESAANGDQTGSDPDVRPHFPALVIAP